jgi:hypothetical protein
MKNEERRSRKEQELQPLHIFYGFCYKPLPFGRLSMGRLIFIKEASEGFWSQCYHEWMTNFCWAAAGVWPEGVLFGFFLLSQSKHLPKGIT